MVTPIGDPEGGACVDSGEVSCARDSGSVVMSEPLVVTFPAGPTGGGPAIPRVDGSVVVGISDVPGGVHTGGEPVVQGSCHGSVSAMVWLVVRGGGGVGGSPFASGFPDPSSDGFVCSRR